MSLFRTKEIAISIADKLNAGSASNSIQDYFKPDTASESQNKKID